MNFPASPATRIAPAAALAAIAAALLLAGAAPAAEPAKAEKRSEKAARLGRDASFAKADALRAARKHGWKTSGTFGSTAFELVEVSPTGVPVYMQTLISNASISAGARELHLAGGPTGSGILVGVWDQSGARAAHEVFSADGFTNVANKDTSAMAAHSTAVAAVIGANGPQATMYGVAPAAMIHCRTWGNDFSEMYANAMFSPADAGKIQISNHSYGSTHGWVQGNYAGYSGWYWFGGNYMPDGSGAKEDANFGGYGVRSAQIDMVAWESRYFLPVRSAGNDRNDAYGSSRSGDGIFYYIDPTTWMWTPTTWNAATAPGDDRTVNGGFDTIIADSTAKNALAVGSVSDAVINGTRAPQAATVALYSGFGPTDDGRVKPDLVANGETVLAPGSSTNTAYQSVSGTSFASPAVAGVGALLLQEAAELFPGTKLRASTLKALLLHGASDLGRPGPDFETGWGLVDAVGSMEPLVRMATEPEALSMNEGKLDASAATATYVVSWDGSEEFAATLVWTDPTADYTPVVPLDDPTPKLVHDLDIRVVASNGAVFMPFTLSAANPTANAVPGDNTVDNVEQVRIAPGAAPAGNLTITVSHKNSLREGAQEFGLVMTGQDVAEVVETVEFTATPTTGSTGSTVTVSVPAASLPAGATGILVREGSRKIAARNAAVSAGTLTVDFDLSNAQPGAWTLCFAVADGTVCASTPFEVTAVVPSALFEDGFEAASLSNWIAEGAAIALNTQIPTGGVSSALLSGDAVMAAAVDTLGYKDVRLQYTVACRSLRSGSYLAVEATVDGGATWHEVDRIAAAQRWATRSVAMPRTAAGNGDFAVRFRASLADGMDLTVDNVAITGLPAGAWSADGNGQTLIRSKRNR